MRIYKSLLLTDPFRTGFHRPWFVSWIYFFPFVWPDQSIRFQFSIQWLALNPVPNFIKWASGQSSPPLSSDGRETICFHRPPVIGHPASGRRAAVWTDLCGCRSLKGAGLWAGEISCSFWQHGADLRPSMLSRRHGGRHSAVASRKPAQGHNKSNSRNRTKVFFIRPIRFFPLRKFEYFFMRPLFDLSLHIQFLLC